MPAEWEPHEATWLSWPRRDGISFPDSYSLVVPCLVSMVKALAESETVRINVFDAAMEADLRKWLAGVPPERVEYFHIPTNEPWCRDHGPIFLTREKDPRLAIVDFGYNAWGNKYPPFDKDDIVPAMVAGELSLPLYTSEMILEGGSIDINGKGVLLTTESCLLNPNRNPSMSRGEIEQTLRDYLGVSTIIWLGDGIEGDDTDGHIDDLTRFVNADTVVTVVEDDRDDNNHKPLQENLEKLRGVVLPGGRSLNVMTLPMPARIDREDLRLPASYANFYIANTSVLLPVFGDPNDSRAEGVLREAFPTRRIVPIDCREVIWGLGAIHCLTQQQPCSR